jgi:hypothetical protein
MSEKLTLPAGIDDATTRALLKVLERWDDLPIERVLVWMVDHVVESALPHIAEMLGVNGPEFAAGPPRAFLRKAIELRRRRGTVGALEEVLATLGYTSIEIKEGGDQQRYDGAIRYDGVHRYGSDTHWAIFLLYVDVTTGLSADEVRKLWDAAWKWRPKSRHPRLVIRQGAVETWFRDRSEIIADIPAPGAGGWSPLDDAALTSGLWLPGGYSTTGTAGVDEVGIWNDESGNGRHASSAPTLGYTAPTAAGGYPTFTGYIGLIIPASFANALASAAQGAIVVIAETTVELATDTGLYVNPTIVSGSGATPHLIASDMGLRAGGYDTVYYIEDYEPGVVTDTPFVGAAKWDAEGIYTSLDGAPFGAPTPYNPGATGLDPSNMGATAYVGMGYGGNYVWNGPIKAVAIYPNAADVDDAKLAQWQAWAIAQGLV